MIKRVKTEIPIIDANVTITDEDSICHGARTMDGVYIKDWLSFRQGIDAHANATPDMHYYPGITYKDIDSYVRFLKRSDCSSLNWDWFMTEVECHKENSK